VSPEDIPTSASQPAARTPKVPGPARIAGAPISWGVCEVPGWGYQMPAERVLSEMASLGLQATEAGPDGFLPDSGEELASMLGKFGLSLVGGFVPLEVLGDWQPTLARNLSKLSRAGAEVVVLAASSGREGYDARPSLDRADWERLCQSLTEAAKRVEGAGLLAALHPHVGTLVQTPEEIGRVLDGTDISLCLDTGHVMAGGGDPMALVRKAAERIGHVHFKDVQRDLAAAVAQGSLSYSDAVRRGLYCPLGAGDVAVREIVASLTGSSYRGWYVLEQDLMLAGEPPEGEGPISYVRQSLEYLLSCLGSSA
jgi:inosose dehydratase